MGTVVGGGAVPEWGGIGAGGGGEPGDGVGGGEGEGMMSGLPKRPGDHRVYADADRRSCSSACTGSVAMATAIHSGSGP